MHDDITMADESKQDMHTLDIHMNKNFEMNTFHKF